MQRHFLRVACIQVAAGSDLEKNLARVETLIAKAASRNPDLIALPENFAWRGASKDLPDAVSQAVSLIKRFQKIACQCRSAILLGSLLEPSQVPGKYFNTSILIAKSGEVAARYRKIHLFQIGLKTVRTDEARHVVRGSRPVLGRVGKVISGLSICFDLRFPELYRALSSRGARILFVPSNFTYVTGRAHWEVLLRARAIENQCFVVAPAQSGIHPESGIKSFGSSLIIDPWGNVLARAKSSGEEIIWSDLDLKAQSALRRDFPVLESRVL